MSVQVNRAPATVKVPMFGDVSIEDGTIILMDGGIHGIQGHTLTIAPTGLSTWERRVESLQPDGKAGSGTLELTSDELSQVRGWADALWPLAPSGKAAFKPPIGNGPPRWVWGIVLRRDGEVRVLHGGGITPPTGAPEPADQVLEWLIARVDSVSGVE